MSKWQLKAIQWGFLILLIAASPLILREIRKKGGLAQMQYLNNQPVQAQAQPLPPRNDLETRYRRCYGLPQKTPIAFNDNELNNEVYACERTRS
ncbi:hypothetical protein [Pseudanabaena sp. 'Roaring Creek']|uniref:hypothetical protein n=1 Tax=Pseudanabaena sp. 'Roaring Creek' TaxID=1681830 RepID=UPI0006D7B8EA|nr:hypothetical protein [Pseudanabaena sp. 'Roaring Creek']